MDELQDIVLSVYRLAQEATVEDFQKLALGLIRDVLPFDSCRWGAVPSNRTDHGKFGQVYPDNEVGCIMEAYAALAELKHIGVMAAAPSGWTMNVNAHHRSAGQPAHAPFLDYLCLFRRENLLVTGVVLPLKVAKSFSLYRADRHDHFSEHERKLSETLFPHMVEALAFNLKLNLARFNDDIGPARWPMAMCNCDGLLLYAEPEFSKLLAEQWPGTVPRWLPQAIADTLLVRRKRHCLAERVLVCVSQRTGDVVYLKARPRQAVDELTERELQVARLVARGMSFKEVAAALNVAPATARNHIQRIHERLGIRSNAELASTLASALP